MYVRFTVTVGLPGSGKRRTRRPLARRYSVMPSTVVTLSGLPGAAGAAAFGRAEGLAAGFAAGAGVWANDWIAKKKPSSARPPVRFKVIGNPPRATRASRAPGRSRAERILTS